MIVGIAGRKCAGKSTVALRLCEQGFFRLSFATPIKKMVRVLLSELDIDPLAINDASSESKEVFIDPLGVSYRSLLQTLGTEWGRRLVHDDVWLLCAQRAIAEYAGFNIVFDDVRFENEAQFIRDHGGLIIHLHRANELIDGHSSEAGIDFFRGDVIVENNGTREGLFNRVSVVLDEFLRVDV